MHRQLMVDDVGVDQVEMVVGESHMLAGHLGVVDVRAMTNRERVGKAKQWRGKVNTPHRRHFISCVRRASSLYHRAAGKQLIAALASAGGSASCCSVRALLSPASTVPVLYNRTPVTKSR